MNQTTIAAISSPIGSGGVGIIKISGPDSIKTVAALFRSGKFAGAPSASGTHPSFFCPWKIYYGHIVNPATLRVFDEVIIAVMTAPKSYTREDVVEIQAHGGAVILDGILSLLIERGIQMAQPGEFTRRAFLNGRIDLAQAEAVIDLINAQNDAAVDIALLQSLGNLSSSIAAIQSGINITLATIEAMIDFPDSIESELDYGALASEISAQILPPIVDLLASYDAHKSLREGFRAVIAGAPNVGKSSILNALSGSERAIVTDYPGTTRDYLETTVNVGNIPVTLVDTAGLRSCPDPIEEMGIQKTFEVLQNADLVLFVFDASRPVNAEEILFLNEVNDKSILFLVVNKIDIRDIDTGGLNLPVKPDLTLETSAMLNIGVDELKHAILDTAINRMSSQQTSRPVPNSRHKALLTEARNTLQHSIDNLNNRVSPEITSIDLRHAYERLGEITGSNASPEILDHIFNRYCIGK